MKISPLELAVLSRRRDELVGRDVDGGLNAEGRLELEQLQKKLDEIMEEKRKEVRK